MQPRKFDTPSQVGAADPIRRLADITYFGAASPRMERPRADRRGASGSDVRVPDEGVAVFIVLPSGAAEIGVDGAGA